MDPSEIEIEAGAERGEVAVVVVDELEGRLHGEYCTMHKIFFSPDVHNFCSP